MELNRRQIKILVTVVDEFIATALPVGSSKVAKKCGLSLSSASIRAHMAELKANGFLEQPHTSAGAVPTTMGLRYYLDNVFKLKTLDESEQALVNSALGRSGLEISSVLKEASRLLSGFSKQVSLVVTPAYDKVRWRRVEFVSLGGGVVMAILVLDGAIVQKRMIRLDENLSRQDLQRYADYLNRVFQDKTVLKAQIHILKELEQARNTLDELSGKALGLAKSILEQKSEQDFLVEGTSNLVANPEFSDVGTMRDLLFLLDERSSLLSLLTKTMRERGMTIFFGAELSISDFEDYGVIASPYRVGDIPVGMVGVIGPKRMDYNYLAPMVDYTAQVLTRIFMQLDR